MDISFDFKDLPWYVKVYLWMLFILSLPVRGVVWVYRRLTAPVIMDPWIRERFDHFRGVDRKPRRRWATTEGAIHLLLENWVRTREQDVFCSVPKQPPAAPAETEDTNRGE